MFLDFLKWSAGGSNFILRTFSLKEADDFGVAVQTEKNLVCLKKERKFVVEADKEYGEGNG